jgi:transcription antitermination factor NusG
MNYSQLNQLSLEELRNLNSLVVEVMNSKRAMVAYEKKQELRVGMNVKVNHPKLMGKQLRVEKVNRTKASLKVLTGGFGSYTVPLSMIEIVK